MESLWPTLRPDSAPTPLSILRRQAQLLFRTTKGLLEGEVVTEGREGWFTHGFFVVAPVLGSFRYHMFDLQHQVSPLYPVTVMRRGAHPNTVKDKVELRDEGALIDWLRTRFDEEKPVLEQLLGDSLPDSELAEAR
ncbi:MAG: hypothetical protein U0Q16_21565 [Bryobacteraceae bacterium]